MTDGSSRKASWNWKKREVLFGFPKFLFFLPTEWMKGFCKVVLTFESVYEILWCDHSNESYWAVLSCGTVYYAVQGGSNFWVCGWNPMVWPFPWNLSSSAFTWYYLFFCILQQGPFWDHFGRHALPLWSLRDFNLQTREREWDWQRQEYSFPKSSPIPPTPNFNFR